MSVAQYESEFKLLTRDEFRESVFKRDGYKCVACKAPAKDAHHLIERRLFGATGGYYLENGASVCEEHHIEAEQTKLSCERLRELCGITKYPIPAHFYKDQETDKWGNPILPNGMRLRGELFDDPSVQKIIAPVLSLFTNRVKYPRTWHCPWSEGATDDDRILPSMDSFIGKNVVVTTKMDGENCTLYNDYIHARSLEYNPHPSRSYVKSLHAQIAHGIPKDWRVCGENLYAKHSIYYDKLESYLQVFSIWNDRNICLNWNDTVEWTELLGLITVPVLYRGIYDEKIIRNLYSKSDENSMEGYVIRIDDSFHYKEFKNSVAKFVRKNHVTTHGHWMRQSLIPNKLKSKS